MSAPGTELLSVSGLEVTFRTDAGELRAVDGLSFDLRPGEILGIVGESGSGKSVANLSILGLTRGPDTTISGRADFDGRDLITLDEEELRELRGNRISMIFQDPLSSLHPFYTVGKQLIEAIQVHRDVRKEEAAERAAQLLEMVGIPDARRRLDEYPHEFSGGMRQRAMIAMALANEPDVLIADEPTTALDVTTQAQILGLIKELRDRLGMAVIMITHDLGVIAEVADRVLVMYAGRAVESAPVDALFYDPQHPYTWGLLGSITRMDRPRAAKLAQIKGQPPSPLALPTGCKFRPRCPHAFDRCAIEPPLEPRAGDPAHADRCWLSPDEKRAKRVVEGGEIGLEAA